MKHINYYESKIQKIGTKIYKWLIPDLNIYINLCLDINSVLQNIFNNKYKHKCKITCDKAKNLFCANFQIFLNLNTFCLQNKVSCHQSFAILSKDFLLLIF